jgi:hypothetical protein
MTGQASPRGTPMCDRWYEHAGDYRPWHGHQDASCTCGLNVHYPDSEHDLSCPVRQNHARHRLLEILVGGPER